MFLSPRGLVGSSGKESHMKGDYTDKLNALIFAFETSNHIKMNSKNYTHDLKC